MDKISVKIPVTIKVKLTEKFRTNQIEAITNNLKNVDLEIQQIDIDEKKVIAEQGQNDLQRLQAIRQHFGVERQKRLDFKAQSEQEMATLKKLALGAEIVQGTLDRVAELKVGDNMRELMNVEVLIEDDKIIAIRS